MEREILSFLPELERRVARTRPITVQLMGPHGGEGTSTVTSALARCTTRRLGMNVLVVRLSRSPSPVPNDETGADAKTTTVLEDLDRLDAVAARLPGEKRDGQYIELELGARAAATLRTSRDDREHFVATLNPLFDMTFVDAPPATTAADGILLAPFVHGIILVVEAEVTRHAVGAAAVDRIRQTGAEILGVVFNKRRYHIPDVVYRML